MKMHSVAAVAVVVSLLGAAPALAVQGNPIGGIGVSVENSPGGIMVPTTKCTPPYGNLVKHSNGKWYCDLMRVITTTTMTPTKPLTPAKPLTTAPAGH